MCVDIIILAEQVNASDFFLIKTLLKNLLYPIYYMPFVI